MLKVNNSPSLFNKQKTNFCSTSIASLGLRAADLFVKSQENLSSTRFIQDTATNWLPKAVFSRSKADIADQSFLEFVESAIFYFASPVLGEKLFRNKLFAHFQPKNLKQTINEQIPKSAGEILSNKNLSKEVKNRALTTKAGIVLACLAIPVAEYTLSFAKNLFTLKAFKTSNFNNIANLNKNKPEAEDKAQQDRVEKNSKKQLKKAALYSLAGISAGAALAKKGYKSEKLVELSKNILEPGKWVNNILNIKNEKVSEAVKSISLDFASNNGKLALSKGQLGLTAIVGLFGYSKAARDRGKLDVAEVWTRVPLVVFYTIFGSELFEKFFIQSLAKKNKFPDLIKQDEKGKLFVPKRDELEGLAAKLAKQNQTNESKEFSKLLKQKAFTSAIPYAFSLLFMGFSLSAITRFWTQFRYNHQKKQQQPKIDTVLSFNKKLPDIYSAFQR